MKKNVKRTFLLSFLSLFVLLSIIFVVHIIYMRNKSDILDGIEFSRTYLDKNNELLQVFLTKDEKYRIYKPVYQYPDEFLELLLLQEDKYFYTHKGINVGSIFRAFWETYVKKSRRIGASTITMQVAKLKYKLYTKNISGKINQILKALYLEMCYSKEEILNAYLNLAPCGGNIEGFESASRYYFSKTINQLNLSENTMLCVLPQNPIKRAPTESRTPSELIQARKVLFSKWVLNHPEDSDYEVFMDMQMSVECRFPDEARHFTEMLNGMQESNSEKKSKIIKPVRTTIDVNLQRKCEDLLKSYIKQNEAFGVKNGAILLVDWTNMNVEVNIGSADYYNEDINGFVNATTSKRSPGSALKPFIYALALEQGKIHYRTMLKDTPQNFSEYSPDNYGSIFKGPVQAWFALSDSRNIPAIYLNRQIRDRNLYDFLVESGVSDMKPTGHYGLSIVLGTCEVTMLEIAKMYGTLKNKGIQYDLNFTPFIGNREGKRLLTEESSFIVLKMLEENAPPYRNVPKEVENIPIPYKTGTSIGFKDAWSVGFFDRYMIVVWIGNFNGQGNNSFIGRKMAAPLLFDIAYSILCDIPQKDLLPQKPHPEGCTQISVCSVSGAIPNEDCPETELSWFIPGVSPIEKCRIHRKINIDTRTGYRTDETEEENQYVKSVVREFWPSDLQSLFEQAGLPRILPPEYPPEQVKLDYSNKGYPPEIVSPLAHTKYVFRGNDTSRNKIILSATADADTTELMWFYDSKFIGRSKPNEIIEWDVSTGEYELMVTDQKGRADSIHVSVIYENR